MFNNFNYFLCYHDCQIHSPKSFKDIFFVVNSPENEEIYGVTSRLLDEVFYFLPSNSLSPSLTSARFLFVQLTLKINEN